MYLNPEKHLFLLECLFACTGKNPKHVAPDRIRVAVNMHRFLVIAAGFAAGVPTVGRCVTSAETEFFEKQVRPVLVQHCYKCHGPDKQKAELRLDSREAVLKGSDAGAVVVPGKPDE